MDAKGGGGVTFEDEERQYESWAEYRFSPYVEQVAKELSLEFEYQHRINETKSWDWVEWEPEDDAYLDDDCDDDDASGTRWRMTDTGWQKGRYHHRSGTNTYEKYRLDFVLKGNGVKINVEVDGKKWHDPEKDAARDKYVRGLGYHVIRIPASDVNRSPIETAIRVRNEIRMMMFEAIPNE